MSDNRRGVLRLARCMNRVGELNQVGSLTGRSPMSGPVEGNNAETLSHKRVNKLAKLRAPSVSTLAEAIARI